MREPILFGKLPDRADFVRRGGASAALDALDALTQQALRSGAKVTTGPLYRLVYVPPSGPDALVGALQISRDRVRRAYPLVVGRPVGRARLDPDAAAAWPLRWRALLDGAAGLVHAAVAQQVPLGDVEARLARLPPLAPPDGRAPEIDAHVRTLDALPTASLWAQIWGTPDSARMGLVLRRLLDAPGGPPAFGVRFPLPPAASAFGPGDAVAFWLAVCWHLLPTPALPPSLFWTDEALVVFVAGVAPSAFRSLLAGVHAPARIARLDAGSADTARRAFRTLPDRLQRLLTTPDLSVARLLGQLHTTR